MKYDITDKLLFRGNPTLIIQDIEVEVQADAKTVMKIAELSDGETSGTAIQKFYEVLFTEKDREKIDSLKLSGEDFVKMLELSMAIVQGEDIDTYEQQSDAPRLV